MYEGRKDSMEERFIIIGLSDEVSPSLSANVLQLIQSEKYFSGGERHRCLVERWLPRQAEWISLTVPLEQSLRQYRLLMEKESRCRIVLFASCDPLFFGIANTVRREFSGEGIRLYPSFNSLQMLAHRLVMPYHDMHVVSLTGRPWKELDTALIERRAKIGLLTDHRHTPAAIARRLLEYGYTYYIMYVGEHLGNRMQEKVTTLSLEEAADREFDTPNCVLLHADPSSVSRQSSQHVPFPVRPFGLPDAAFKGLEGRPYMITKMPIRLLTLQALDLRQHRVLWDIGFCTGSVSIEAKLQFPHLDVIAFENRIEGERLMTENCRHFGTPGITFHIGDFLQEDLAEVPSPDAVFIGGHGGRLKEIMQRVTARLQPGGCLVFNSVSEESKQLFETGCHETGLVLLPPVRVAIDEYNPILIMKACLTDKTN